MRRFPTKTVHLRNFSSLRPGGRLIARMGKRKFIRVGSLVLTFLLGMELWPLLSNAAESDLLPPPSEPSKSEALDQKILKRRKLLQLHQALGIATVAVMGA